ESNDSVDSKGIRYHTYANIGSNGSLGGSLYISYNPIKWLSFWSSLSAGYERYTNRASISEGAFFSEYGGVNIKLPWKMRFNIGMGGNPAYTSYRSKGNGWYYYYTSLSRSFLKGDKLSVSISASNFLEKYNTYRNTSWVEGVYTSNSVSRSLARSFSISLSWRFGEMKAQIKKAERGISNDDVKSGGGSGGNAPN
ncbi:MAG: TonB-dependent receptor, partial [Bacteroidetes bacterium]